MNVTKQRLDARIKELNIMIGAPIETYTKQDDGKFKINVGNYYLNYAYGSVSIQQVREHDGEPSSYIVSGYDTSKNTYNWLCGFVAGLSLSK